MRKLLLSSVALIAMPALADPVVDTRKIMAGTVTTTKIKNEYISGARDGTAPFKGALSAYKAVRAAEPPLTVKCADGTVIVAPGACPVVVTPTPIPTASGWVPSPSLAGLPDKPISDFDSALGKYPSALPPTNAPDTVGAFRFPCGPGHLLADDPIVYPGQRGKSHLHQFYGNLDVNADSTHDSLLAHGKSTCSGPDFPLNRSGYWIPALLDGKGNAVRPDYLVVYYKRFPKASMACTNAAYSKGCVPIPNGLKMIAGRDMSNLAAPATGNFHFSCTKATGETKGSFRTLGEALAVCTEGWQASFTIDFPDCWDGQHLDSPDHRSHVAYSKNALGFPGALSCPSTHPYFMPVLRLTAAYSILSGDDPALWRLSSDMDQPAGSTLHADYFEAWAPSAKKEWTDNCIDKLLSCQSGNLGNGFALKGAYQPPQGFGNPANPRLVPIASIP